MSPLPNLWLLAFALVVAAIVVRNLWRALRP